jgi:acetyl esterase
MYKIDVLNKINSQMKAVIDKSNELVDGAYDTSAGFDVLRENYTKERAFWNQGGPTPHKTIDSTLATENGEIKVRYYVPTDAEKLPAIIYIHGGGFVLGNLDTHDRIMRILAEETGAIVAGIDYSLSPEAKFPVAIQQCARFAQYLHTEGAQFGIDTDHISFAGDSGGAFMSLATTFYLRDELKDNSYIRGLLLFYGLFGLRDSMSWRLLGGPWDGLTTEDMEYYYQMYTSSPEDRESPYFDTLNNDFTQGVPPCYVCAAEFDPLRDDSTTLAAILDGCNIPYKYELFEGVIHAFLHNSLMLDEAMDALKNSSAFYREVIK